MKDIEDLDYLSKEELLEKGIECGEIAHGFYIRAKPELLRESLKYGWHAAEIYEKLRLKFRDKDVIIYELVWWLHCFTVSRPLGDINKIKYIKYKIKKICKDSNIPNYLKARITTEFSILYGDHGDYFEGLIIAEKASKIFQLSKTEKSTIQKKILYPEKLELMNERRVIQYSGGIKPNKEEYIIQVDSVSQKLIDIGEIQSAGNVLITKLEILGIEYHSGNIKEKKEIFKQAVEIIEKNWDKFQEGTATAKTFAKCMKGFFFTRDKYDVIRFKQGVSSLIEAVKEMDDGRIVAPSYVNNTPWPLFRPDLVLRELFEKELITKEEFSILDKITIIERENIPIKDEEIGFIKDFIKTKGSDYVQSGKAEEKEEDSFWVEWCILSAKGKAKSPQKGMLNKEQVDKLRKIKDKFVIYLDETEPGWRIYINKSGKSKIVRKLNRQKRYFLGLIFRAFQEKGPIQESLKKPNIVTKAMNQENVDGGEDCKRQWDEVRRLKSELFNDINGVFDEVIVAYRNDKMYIVKSPISYCWIRNADKKSLLESSPL